MTQNFDELFLVRMRLHRNDSKMDWAKWGAQSRQAEIDEKDKRIEAISLLVTSLRNEFDLHGGNDQVERQIELLEEALRGDNADT